MKNIKTILNESISEKWLSTKNIKEFGEDFLNGFTNALINMPDGYNIKQRKHKNGFIYEIYEEGNQKPILEIKEYGSEDYFKDVK